MFAHVDESLCQRIAARLKQFTIPEDTEDTSIEGLSPSQTSDFYLLLVGICHQTQTLKGTIGGEPKRGWDYLRLKLLAAATQAPDLLKVGSWNTFDVERLQQIMRDDVVGETLSDAAGRVGLIRDLGAVFMKHGWAGANELFEKSDRDAVRIMDSLAEAKAYNDPVRKKTYFYLGLVANAGAFELSNFDNVGAPVDYHEVRGHLRLGTVVLEPELREKLKGNRDVSESEDVAIRRSVHDAIVLIACELSITPMRLHYLFWNLFRNICDRENPFCRSKCSSLPARYQHFSVDGCPMNEECKSIDEAPKLLEHTFSTDWY